MSAMSAMSAMSVVSVDLVDNGRDVRCVWFCVAVGLGRKGEDVE